MEAKTKLIAAEGKHDILIKREFDLPLDLLFKAYEVPELVEQWMGTKVLKLENKKHGSWQFETLDPHGNIAFKANGTIHEFVQNKGFTRTFEMENSNFPVQLEYFEFKSIGENKSELTMHIIYKSTAVRDEVLKLPFAFGLNMAHNRLEEIITNLK